MRIAVTGSEGQVVRSLIERAQTHGARAHGASIVAIGRPRLDLAEPATILPALKDAAPDFIVNAAAYTAVDLAESDEPLALRINGEGAGAVAEAARALNVPIIHLSTDYVFDGSLDRPYREDDTTAPINAYGRTKLAGESAVAAATPAHVILRTAWVYSPFGRNFVRTMLHLGASRSSVNVVADQLGHPTSALAIADAIFAIAATLKAEPAAARFGLFHLSGTGEASWADFAQAIFADAERHGRAPVAVNRIASADYKTAAERPKNSRLDNGKLARIYGVTLPPWQVSLVEVVTRLLENP